MCQQCDELKAFTFDDASPKPPILSDDLIAAVLLLLWDDSTRNMMQTIRQNWGSTITFQQNVFPQLMTQIARNSAQAAQLGRRRATGGDDFTFNEDDLAFGQSYALEQKKYVQKMIDDYLDGKYGPVNRGYDSPEVQEEVEKSERRMRAHSNRLIGAANEAFVLALPDHTKIWWELSEYAAERHCIDCPRIAAGSPYTKETLKQYPKDGRTQCIINCLCWLKTETGARSFIPLPVAQTRPEDVPQIAGV